MIKKNISVNLFSVSRHLHVDHPLFRMYFFYYKSVKHFPFRFFTKKKKKWTQWNVKHNNIPVHKNATLKTDWIIIVGDLHTISNSKAQGDSGSITYTDNLFKTVIHTCDFVSKKLSQIVFTDPEI